MLLYQTNSGVLVNYEHNWYSLANSSWDYWVRLDYLYQRLIEEVKTRAKPTRAPENHMLLPPIGKQEVWAAGVTYYRSREARMEESQEAGGSDFYDQVYNASRPELFMKATPHRVVGHRGEMRLRKDSAWIVPEPELTLLINPAGNISGYTIGNDLSCRDIEGENPLYLPQAKTFDACAALGPGVLITEEPLPEKTGISLVIKRFRDTVFKEKTDISQMKKLLQTLVDYLYQEMSFPDGSFLMTGTGIVPPEDFSLERGDEVHITIDGIGTLVNTVK